MQEKFKSVVAYANNLKSAGKTTAQIMSELELSRTQNLDKMSENSWTIRTYLVSTQRATGLKIRV